jgi:hypothetical protein
MTLFERQEVNTYGRQGDSVPLLFPPLRGRGLAPFVSSSVGSADGSMLNPTSKEMIKNISRQVRKLEGRTQLIDSTLPVSFSQVCAKLNDIWKEIGDIKLVLWVGGGPLAGGFILLPGASMLLQTGSTCWNVSPCPPGSDEAGCR